MTNATKRIGLRIHQYMVVQNGQLAGSGQLPSEEFLIFSESCDWNGTCHCKGMLNHKRSSHFAAGALLVLTAGLALAKTPAASEPLDTRVRQELLKLPYNGVFDYLQFSVDGDTVTLSGQASNYVLRRDALNAVKHLPGVKTVNDQIEVLPLSPFDDDIRLRVFHSLYRDSALNRYRLIRVQPPIRILVNNGNVTLSGVVDSEMDRNVVYDRTREVSKVFSVANDLKVQ